MKIRILDRILVALAGLILIAGCVALVAQVVFQMDVTGLAARIMANPSFGRRAALLLIALGLLLLGCYCFMVLFRHRKKKDRFVFQENENGELAISMKVLDQLVRKCLAEHPELDVQTLEMTNRRNGLQIRVSGNAAGGISIPLTMEALQKQIKQYVTACSGVEISSVEVEIETSGAEVPGAAFAIPAPTGGRLPRETEREIKEEPAREPVEKQETPEELQEKYETAAPKPEAAPMMIPTQPEATHSVPEKAVSPAPVEDIPDEDDRPMHQRLFSAQPEPCIIPEPPVEAEETVERVDPPKTEATTEASQPVEAERPEETERLREAVKPDAVAEFSNPTEDSSVPQTASDENEIPEDAAPMSAGKAAETIFVGASSADGETKTETIETIAADAEPLRGADTEILGDKMSEPLTAEYDISEDLPGKEALEPLRVEHIVKLETVGNEPMEARIAGQAFPSETTEDGTSEAGTLTDRSEDAQTADRIIRDDPMEGKENESV